MKHLMMVIIFSIFLSGYKGNVNIVPEFKYTPKKYERLVPWKPQPFRPPKKDRWGKTKRDYKMKEMKDRAERRLRFRPLRDKIRTPR